MREDADLVGVIEDDLGAAVEEVKAGGGLDALVGECFGEIAIEGGVEDGAVLFEDDEVGSVVGEVGFEGGAEDESVVEPVGAGEGAGDADGLEEVLAEGGVVEGVDVVDLVGGARGGGWGGGGGGVRMVISFSVLTKRTGPWSVLLRVPAMRTRAPPRICWGLVMRGEWESVRMGAVDVGVEVGGLRALEFQVESAAAGAGPCGFEDGAFGADIVGVGGDEVDGSSVGDIEVRVGIAGGVPEGELAGLGGGGCLCECEAFAVGAEGEIEDGGEGCGLGDVKDFLSGTGVPELDNAVVVEIEVDGEPLAVGGEAEGGGGVEEEMLGEGGDVVAGGSVPDFEHRAERDDF